MFWELQQPPRGKWLSSAPSAQLQFSTGASPGAADNYPTSPAPDHMLSQQERIRSLAAARDRIAALLTAAMVAIYFGFIALIAFAKPFLARQLVPGLTVGIALGVLVIVASWLLTLVYVRWANAHYDTRLDDARFEGHR